MSNERERTLYFLALSTIPGVGDIVAKKLVAYCGGVKEVFDSSRSALMKIPGIGKILANAVSTGAALREAEKEFIKADSLGIQIVSYLDETYPHRLKHCQDSPIVLYTKGNMDLNPSRCIAVVGTRNASNHGKEITERLISELASSDITIISGLAYGIDIAAHRAALQNGIPTIAALAHGLDRVYPSVHANVAQEMLENGGLVADFPTGTKPDRENFPKRNRIVAGMCDATVVIEAGIKGGALITAEIANGYNRDVFAIPGRPSDQYSEGCNSLIMQNKAALITAGDDILQAMGWEESKPDTKQKLQTRLLIDLTPQQEKLVEALREKNLRIDQLAIATDCSMSTVAAVLLELEFDGIVTSLPGKVYKLT